jgi:acyl carrier protein
MDTTLGQLTQVFRQVFNDDELVISRQTTAKDVSEWDSLMHVSLIIAAEKTFKIRFSSAEVSGLKNVGDLVDLIEAKNSA